MPKPAAWLLSVRLIFLLGLPDSYTKCDTQFNKTVNCCIFSFLLRPRSRNLWHINISPREIYDSDTRKARIKLYRCSKSNCPFYFANPHHSWARATNENNNKTPLISSDFSFNLMALFHFFYGFTMCQIYPSLTK